MPEPKNDEIVSLNVKMSLILQLVWKTNRILQYEGLFFIIRLILVRIWKENLLKYGRGITKSFLCTGLTTGFGVRILSKNSLMHLLTKSCVQLFLYKILFNL